MVDRADDVIWKALSDPTRRRILDLLAQGGAPGVSTSDLGAHFSDLTRFAVMKHLQVLEDAGVVVSEKVGRVRLNRINAVPLRAVYEAWVDRWSDRWADHALRLKGHAEGAARGGAGSAPPTDDAQWLVTFTPPRPTFAEDASEEERGVIARHFAYLKALSDRGVVLLAGRTLDEPPLGLVILRAGDEAAARAVVDGDPAVAGGLFKAQIRPYRVAIEAFSADSAR